MIKIKCLFFAASKDIVGKKQVTIECEKDTSLVAFQKLLFQNYPELSGTVPA
jgi:hypothetical protein